MQVGKPLVDQRRIMAGPYQVLVMHQRRMHIVQGGQLSGQQRRIDKHINTPAPHFLQSVATFTAVEDVDFQPKFGSDLIE
ncbi:hypothetical protein D3C79_760100 [compost metagenome]